MVSLLAEINGIHWIAFVCWLGGLRAACRHWLRPKKTNTKSNSIEGFLIPFSFFVIEWNEWTKKKRNGMGLFLSFAFGWVMGGGTANGSAQESKQRQEEQPINLRVKWRLLNESKESKQIHLLIWLISAAQWGNQTERRTKQQQLRGKPTPATTNHSSWRLIGWAVGGVCLFFFSLLSLLKRKAINNESKDGMLSFSWFASFLFFINVVGYEPEAPLRSNTPLPLNKFNLRCGGFALPLFH